MQGFSPKGGPSPVEHRGNLCVHMSLRPSVCTYPEAGWLRPPSCWLPEAWGGDVRTDVHKDVATYRFPLSSTELHPPLGLMPKNRGRLDFRSWKKIEKRNIKWINFQYEARRVAGSFSKELYFFRHPQCDFETKYRVFLKKVLLKREEKVQEKMRMA